MRSGLLRIFHSPCKIHNVGTQVYYLIEKMTNPEQNRKTIYLLFEVKDIDYIYVNVNTFPSAYNFESD